LKFTLKGEISVSLKQVDVYALLEIRDTGVGVPAEEVPRLFERFHRVEGVQGRTQEGSGIGLALVQELVKLHGGSVTVESTLGVGSIFRVALPLGSAHVPAESVRQSHALNSPAVGAQAFVQEALRWLPDAANERISASSDAIGAKDPRFANTFGARIVLADDNADMRMYLRELLQPHYEVGILQRQVPQLTRLVDDLLDVSRITQGKIELRRQPIQLAEIIEQSIETVDTLLKHKHHTVSVISDRTPLWVHGDPARLLQCIGNIPRRC
jgi:signal transduction histidine kinase